MRFLKVIFNFSRKYFNDLELIAKALLICKQMMDNPHFLTPVPSLEDLNTATGKFIESVTNAKEGG